MKIEMADITKRIEETEALGEDLCNKLRDQANKEYALDSSGDIDIDCDALCLKSDDEGYWVEAWVFIRKDELPDSYYVEQEPSQAFLVRMQDDLEKACPVSTPNPAPDGATSHIHLCLDCKEEWQCNAPYCEHGSKHQECGKH